MQGYTTNYINLIADNLRDRYDNGFPILKELIQNADDAKARNFVFAFHRGFRDAGPHIHPLLTGPGLWFFNDGEFKASDARALRSFGINSKAGDATAIGKFGLGMKSVFHLCEALFYVAWDGRDHHNEGLTPWKQEDHNPHPEWDESHADDWQCLKDVAGQQVTDRERSWFLLWIPLRKRAHLQKNNGEETGAIISRFPGDEPGRELAFLNREDLAVDLAELLPLLRHLERIEHRDVENPFVLKLYATGRLLSEHGPLRTNGRVLADPENHSIQFAGLRRLNHDPDGLFSRMKNRDEWPRSWYRDDNGKEHLAEDKTTPEGAVLFCTGPATQRLANLHWAVFLPVEQGGDKLRCRSEGQGHSLTRHGQFFVDAGRKKIHGLEYLEQTSELLGNGIIDDGILRRTWNQQLAQQVLLPLVLPALQHYAQSAHLGPEECASLTEALANTKWFSTFRAYICSESAWVQLLKESDKPVWSLVDMLERDRLRPFPEPPRSDPGRPWRVFRRLSETGLLPFSADAPSLLDRHPQWQEEELEFLLSEIDGLFADGPLMDYLAVFLKSRAGPYLSTERLQRRLVDLLRVGLRESDAEARRQLAKKSSALIDYVAADRCVALQADLPETMLRQLWEIEAPVLLVPKEFSAEQDCRAAPSQSTLAEWLRVLDQGLSEGGRQADQDAILTAVRGLLKSLDPEARGSFLRIHEGLRITAVRDARSQRDRAVSYADVRKVRDAGALFGFAGGAVVDRLGLAPRLAAALPSSRIWLVKVETYRDLFPDEAGLPRSDDGQACLRAIGRDGSGRLGGITERRDLLEMANEPGTDADARRGLRYLLHGSPLHRCEDDATLWFPAHAQDPAWPKLWGQKHDSDRWSLVPATLADAVPRTRWERAGIHEIVAHNLINELQRTGADIPTPKDFSVPERDQILSQIDDEALWQRLTLHTTCEGEPVSAAQEQVYLVAEASDVDGWLLREATLVPLSANPVVSDRQHKWLKPLDGTARIDIALGTAEPSAHWRTIMDALAEFDTEEELEMSQQFREKAWLPAQGGTAIRPEDVIELPGNLHDQARRLVAEHRVALGPRFAVPADLSDELQNHEAWERLKIEAFSRGEDALRRIGSLLKDLPHYHIGSWTISPSPETVELLSECDSFPGWRLLRDTSSEQFDFGQVWRHLSSGLAQRMAQKGIRAALKWLSASTGRWKVRKSAFDEYLKQYLDRTDIDRSTFSGLRLANRRGEWRDSSGLCVGADGADTGLDPSFILDPSQAGLLTDLVSHAGGDTSVDEAKDEGQREINHRLFRAAHEKTPQTLARYFEPWGQFVPSPMIGALIAMLDPTSRDLASEYLQPFSYEWLLDQLDDAGGDSIEERFERMQVAVHEIDVASVSVTNLLADPIDVPLDQEARTLFAGPISQKRTIHVQVPLRKIDPADIYASH